MRGLHEDPAAHAAPLAAQRRDAAGRGRAALSSAASESAHAYFNATRLRAWAGAGNGEAAGGGGGGAEARRSNAVEGMCSVRGGDEQGDDKDRMVEGEEVL